MRTQATPLAAIISLRLVPRSDGRGRVPACEVLINTAAVAENIRDVAEALRAIAVIEERMIRLDENIARIGAAVGRLEQQERTP